MQTFKPIKKRIGDLLVDTNLISQEQLCTALELQRKKGIKLGHALLELNYLTKDLLLAFLGRQCGISYISLKEFGDIRRDVLLSVPEYLIREYEIFPLQLKENELVVAVSDPFNVFATDDLRLITGFDIKTVIAPADEIKVYIDRYYTQNGIQTKNFPDNFLMEVVSFGINIGASEIYFNDDVLRYFFNQRYLKTVKLDDKHKTILNSLIYKLSDKTPIQIKNNSQKYFFSAQNFNGTIIVKIKNSSEDVNITTIGFEPNDLITYQKELNTHEGLIVISASAGDGKTTTLEATANYVANNQKITFYFSHQAKKNNPFIVYCHKPFVSNFPFPSHYIFIDDISEEEINSAIFQSQNSCIVCATTNDYPQLKTARLYIKQKLLRKLCNNCKKNYTVTKEYLTNTINFVNTEIPIQNDEIILSWSPGCQSCNFTGYEATIPIFFFLTQNEDINHTRIKNSLLKTIWNKVINGEVSIQEILLYK